MALQYCQKAKELLQQLKRSDWLPPYNVRRAPHAPTGHAGRLLVDATSSCALHLQDNTMREVLEEITALYDEIKATIEVEEFKVSRAGGPGEWVICL